MWEVRVGGSVSTLHTETAEETFQLLRFLLFSGMEVLRNISRNDLFASFEPAAKRFITFGGGAPVILSGLSSDARWTSRVRLSSFAW